MTNDEMCAVIERGTARIRELEAALKPFAEACADVGDEYKDSDHLWEAAAAMDLTAGDLRRAETVFNK